MVGQSEADRRAALRAFLIDRRSRLSPADVGLPDTGRRRVSGLRREEVAELADVSSDWYRWFESGRPIRVSPPFLARLSQALQLSKPDEQMLFSLAVPEFYENELLGFSDATYLPQVSPLRSPNDLNEVLRDVSSARDAFLSGDLELAKSLVRPRIVESWRRSAESGVNYEIQEAPSGIARGHDFEERLEINSRFLRAALPVLEKLEQVLSDSGYAIIVSDGSGCVLQVSGDRSMVLALEKIALEAGADLSETVVGTNAIGTAIADGRPVQLIGAENFVEVGSSLTCTGAPVRDPLSGKIAGVVDVTADCRRIHPRAIAFLTQIALEIEERMSYPNDALNS